MDRYRDGTAHSFGRIGDYDREPTFEQVQALEARIVALETQVRNLGIAAQPSNEALSEAITRIDEARERLESYIEIVNHDLGDLEDKVNKIQAEFEANINCLNEFDYLLIEGIDHLTEKLDQQLNLISDLKRANSSREKDIKDLYNEIDILSKLVRKEREPVNMEDVDHEGPNISIPLYRYNELLHIEQEVYKERMLEPVESYEVCEEPAPEEQAMKFLKKFSEVLQELSNE